MVRSAATANGPTSASDGVRTPPVRMMVWSLRAALWSTSATGTELVTTVRPGTCDEAASECIGRRAGRDADGRARLTERDRGIGDGVLLGLLERRLGCEPRLEQRASRTGRGPAVDLFEQAAVVEQLQVAPDGHIRHAQLAGEVRYTDSTVLADALQDQCLALACEHHRTFLPLRRIARQGSHPSRPRVDGHRTESQRVPTFDRSVAPPDNPSFLLGLCADPSIRAAPVTRRRTWRTPPVPALAASSP